MHSLFDRARTLALLAALAGAVLVVPACDPLADHAADQAKARVITVLDGIKTGGKRGTTSEFQLAMCRWYKDAVIIRDFQEFENASDTFDAWRRRGNIYPTLKSYEVTKVEVVEGTEPLTWLVSGKIDGKPFTMRVPEKAPIEWVKAPRS